MRDALTAYIDVARAIVARDRRVYREVLAMPPLIEIKGLGQAVAGVREEIRRSRDSAGRLQDSAFKLRAEIEDYHAQVEQARSDLAFEAQTLGNSGGSSQQQEPPPVGAGPGERADLHDTKEG